MLLKKESIEREREKLCVSGVKSNSVRTQDEPFMVIKLPHNRLLQRFLHLPLMYPFLDTVGERIPDYTDRGSKSMEKNLRGDGSTRFHQSVNWTGSLELSEGPGLWPQFL